MIYLICRIAMMDRLHPAPREDCMTVTSNYLWPSLLMFHQRPSQRGVDMPTSRTGTRRPVNAERPPVKVLHIAGIGSALHGSCRCTDQLLGRRQLLRTFERTGRGYEPSRPNAVATVSADVF
jgi:hypothetical protein